jgi:hypothetical protein
MKIMKKVVSRKAIVLGIIILFVGAGVTPKLFVQRVKADPNATFEWEGWWIGDTRMTVGIKGEAVTAKIRMVQGPSDHFRIRIMQDIAIGFDKEIATLEFDYNGGSLPCSVSFIPEIATDEQNTRGYYVKVEQKNLVGLWSDVWSMPEYYPPRLRIFSTNELRWTHYHGLGDIDTWIHALEPSGIAKVVSIGKSANNRDIWAIKISDDPETEDQSEPDVLFVGLHHAREWISAEVPFYLAVNLVQKYQTDPTIKTLVDNSEIWIVPVLNPDGFEFTQQPIRIPIPYAPDEWSRFWRPNFRNDPSGTYGVDLNRNYGHSMWGLETYTLGVFPTTSRSIGSDVYCGSSAFSESETTALKNLIMDDGKDFEAVISYHSFGQYILYPWGWSTVDPPKANLLNALANEMSDEIYKKHGKRYVVGQSADTVYETSGDLTDWIYEEKEIPAFTIELRPGQWEFWGSNWVGIKSRFHLPEDQILATCEENLEAAKYLIDWVITTQKGGFMDFEDGRDAVPISSTIPGMYFTTTMGYNWIYGDIRTGNYNVYPYGSRAYECHGNIFAWLGPNQGAGRIDFTGSTARKISMLTSNSYGLYLDAYNSDGVLVDSDYAPGNTNTRTMAELTVEAPSISYVIVHDTGNYWLIDDLRVQDLLRDTMAFRPPDSTTLFNTLDTINMGGTSTYDFFNDIPQTIKLFLNWGGSTFGIQILKPDGSIFFETESDNPPIRVVIPDAEVGTWHIVVSAIEVPYDDYPFALDVFSLPLPADSEPPITIKTVGNPKYGSNDEWVTSSTAFNLTATDDVSGVEKSYYRIWYNGAWNSWMEYTSNFSLSSEGIHYLEYYSVDNAGNIEETHNQTHYVDNSPPVMTISGSPNSLWPPNHKMKNVVISGSAIDTGSGIASLAFTVVDEYDQVEPTITGFGQTIQLEAWRYGNDMEGRTYTITATATDNLGHVTTASTVVLVPHDQGQ